VLDGKLGAATGIELSDDGGFHVGRLRRILQQSTVNGTRGSYASGARVVELEFHGPKAFRTKCLLQRV
jgi:hypothetical protein